MKTPTTDRRSVTLSGGARVNYLVLNAGKTKEMIIDFRKKKYQPKPIEIRGDAIERVESYKYLGVTIDSRLSWKQNTDEMLKKVNTRLFCLSKLNSFAVDQHVLQLFYSSVLCSVLSLVSHPGMGIYANGTIVRWTRLLRSLAVLWGGHRMALTCYMIDE